MRGVGIERGPFAAVKTDHAAVQTDRANIVGTGSSIKEYFIGNNIFDMNQSIHSIANYLENKVQGSLQDKIFDYNNSWLYVEMVTELKNSLN